MPTIRGSLEKIDKDFPGGRWIQVRTVCPGGVAIRTRTFVGGGTLITRGVERVDISSLREGEFVEVAYRRGHSGFMEWKPRRSMFTRTTWLWPRESRRG
jgi:hypothetical protein